MRAWGSRSNEVEFSLWQVPQLEGLEDIDSSIRRTLIPPWAEAKPLMTSHFSLLADFCPNTCPSSGPSERREKELMGSHLNPASRREGLHRYLDGPCSAFTSPAHNLALRSWPPIILEWAAHDGTP
jgi:hypothetical protein